MKKLLAATALLILGTAGTAAADRHRGNRGDHRDHRDRVVTRDRGWNRPVVRDRGVRDRVVRDRVVRRPIYANNGRYHLHNGRTVVYRRPVVNVRYTDYRYRPTLLVENYETVPGYIWVAGNWQWSGYEWQWIDGHYEIDASYGYDDGYSYAPVSSGYQHDCD